MLEEKGEGDMGEPTKHFLTASLTLSTLMSENPLILRSVRVVALWTDCFGRQREWCTSASRTWSRATHSNSMEAGILQLADVRDIDPCGICISDLTPYHPLPHPAEEREVELTMRLQLIDVDNVRPALPLHGQDVQTLTSPLLVKRSEA